MFEIVFLECGLPWTDLNNFVLPKDKISGQSYKHFMLVNYDSRVVPDWKISHITSLES